MQSIFSNALSRAVAKHISLSATRRETLSWLALLIMQHGTISLWRLAAYVASATQIASVRRRFYRFFQSVRIGGPRQTEHLARAHGFRRGVHRQNRRRDGESAAHSVQNTW